MKRMGRWRAGFTVVAAFSFALTAQGMDSDPYAALKLYDGSWEVKISGPQGKTDQLENHCAADRVVLCV